MAVASAYDDLAAGWDAGAGLVYGPLARVLVGASPVELRGCVALDVGSGTGFVADAAAGRGARVVAVDRSATMVAYQDGGRGRVVGDVLRLPFRKGAFDAVLAGFLINHMAPEPALASLGRVVRPGGAVVASTWAVVALDPVKDAIDRVVMSWGWVPPEWYRVMKEDVLPVSGDPALLAGAARTAGLVDVSTVLYRTDLEHDAVAAVAYRLALPHIAPWVAGLAVGARATLVEEARVAVAPHVAGWRPAMIVLSGRVPARDEDARPRPPMPAAAPRIAPSQAPAPPRT